MMKDELRAAAYDMLYLTSCALNGEDPEAKKLEQMNLSHVYQMSVFHSLAAMTFFVLEKSLPDDRMQEDKCLIEWREARDKAIVKNMLLDDERRQLEHYCEEHAIWYMPLKGVLLKELFPQPQLRQMADNDILFDAIYQDKIYEWFTARGYEAESFKIGVEDCYLKAPVYNFEMHTSLFSEYLEPVWAGYYSDIKGRLLLDEGNQFGYHFSDEDFYIYITAHAYKHYKNSGTGLRSLIDCYVYNRAKGKSMDWQYIKDELSHLEIQEFEAHMRQLAKKLYEGARAFHEEELSEEEKELLEYYLFAGTYGTQEINVHNALRNLNPDEKMVSFWTKLRYIKSRLFPDRKFMEEWCHMFAPVLLRHRCLIGAAYVCRFFLNTIRLYSVRKSELKSLWKA